MLNNITIEYNHSTEYPPISLGFISEKFRESLLNNISDNQLRLSPEAMVNNMIGCPGTSKWLHRWQYLRSRNQETFRGFFEEIGFKLHVPELRNIYINPLSGTLKYTVKVVCELLPGRSARKEQTHPDSLCYLYIK